MKEAFLVIRTTKLVDSGRNNPGGALLALGTHMEADVKLFFLFFNLYTE